MDMKTMEFLYKVQIKELDIFLMNDQPFTCPHCGSRCEMLADFYHTNAKRGVQLCLNINCVFICFEEEDEYCLNLWGVI